MMIVSEVICVVVDTSEPVLMSSDSVTINVIGPSVVSHTISALRRRFSVPTTQVSGPLRMSFESLPIRAWTPASEGTATLGIYTNSAGGAVFNAATQRWVYGLRDNPVVSRITRNVIDQLITGEPVPHDEKTAMLLTEETFNCQQYTPRLLAGWTHTLETKAAVTGS